MRQILRSLGCYTHLALATCSPTAPSAWPSHSLTLSPSLGLRTLSSCLDYGSIKRPQAPGSQ